jgi:antitoxin HicB
MNRNRIGSSLDSMFEEFGELEEVKILTRKKILAQQLDQARRAGNVSIAEMARRMGTSRMAVHSLLDQTRPTMTIDSVSRAAVALGAHLEMKVVPPPSGARASTLHTCPTRASRAPVAKRH